MIRGNKKLINSIKQKFYYKETGLNLDEIRKLFPGIEGSFDSNFVQPYRYYEEQLNVVFFTYRNIQHTWELNEQIRMYFRNVSIAKSEELDMDSIVIVYNPTSKLFQYHGHFEPGEASNVEIDIDKPSDVAIVRSFVKYYKHMALLDVKEWNWKLNEAKTNYITNDDNSSISFDDSLLGSVFTSDEWFKNRALDELFHLLLKPYSYTKKNNKKYKEIYCRFISDPETNNDEYIYAEVENDYTRAINESLFKDLTLENRENQNDIIKTREPIFRKNNNALDYIFKPYLYVACFKRSSIENKQLDLIKGNPDKTFKLKIEFPNKEYSDDNYSDCLVFSASPQKMKRIKTLWNELALENHASVSTKSAVSISAHNDCSTISDKMDSCLSSDISLNIYRVGQGNFISGHNMTNDAHFLFDCGIPLFSQIGRAKKGSKSKKDEVDYDFIKGLRPQLIMISHWDYDHYSGLFSLPRCVWENEEFCVVAPFEGTTKFTGWKEDVLNYLNSRNALCLLDVDSKSNPDYVLYSNSNNAALFQGKGSGKNDKSILLRLKHTVLPGDCGDVNWPDKFASKKDIKNIVLPHHGAYGMLDNSEIAKCIKSKGKYNIYICAGFNNEYDHPSFDWILPVGTDKSGCKIICTNIKNPEDQVNSREPVDDNKNIISIYNA